MTPLGRPETERLAFTLNPGCGVIVTVELDEAPWLKVRVDGRLEIVNVGVTSVPFKVTDCEA